MSLSAAKHFELNFSEWVLVFIAAVMIHVLLFFLFQPLEQTQRDHIQDARFTVFLTEEKLFGSKDPYQLDYWLKYTSPETLLNPDIKYGFSAVCSHNSRALPNPAEFRHNLFSSAAEFHPYMESLPESRSLEGFSFWHIEPVVRHPVHRQLSVNTLQYPLWTDDTGRVYSGFFMEDASDARLVRQSAVNNPTVLKLQSGPGKLPVVTVQQSCGNKLLDQLAQRQLSSFREYYHQKKQIERYYYVTWSRPQTVNSIRSMKP